GVQTAQTLTAMNARVGFACARGALRACRRKIAARSGIEVAEVIPGFAARFDLEHVVGAIAPRRCLVVSGTDDKYSAGADDLVELAGAAFRSAPQALHHVRVEGGHALDEHRFERIIEWMTD